ncbi:hypothetical protein M8J77_020886 [Diaphorina citri]|nr:hypothetical protein M8J77_020886 [Diaphorina citri]
MYFFRYLLAICLLWCGHALAKPKETIVGQPAHINVDDPYVQMASQYAVSSISEGSGSKQKLGLLKVVSATRQVVSGSLYTIKLQVARTDCKNDVCAISLSAASRDDPDFNDREEKIVNELNTLFSLVLLVTDTNCSPNSGSFNCSIDFGSLMDVKNPEFMECTGDLWDKTNDTDIQADGTMSKQMVPISNLSC